MSVRWVRMGDVFDLQRRPVEVDPETEYVEIGLRSFGKGVFHKPARAGSEIGTKRVFRIEPDDLLVSNIFGWEGAIALADRSEAGTIGSHRFMTWTAVCDDALPAYVAQYLVSEDGVSKLQRASPGSAGRNRTLSIANLSNLSIPLPALAEQHRVMVRLDAVSRAATCSPGATTLSAAKRAVWGHISTAPTTSLGDVLEMRRDPIELRPGEAYRRIGLYSWGKGFIHRPAAGADEMGSMKYFTFPQQALVVSNIQAWEGATGVSGRHEEDHVASNRFLPYTSTGQVDIDFVGHFMRSEKGLSLLQKASPGTAVRNRTLSRRLFEESSIPLPDLAEQRRIVERLDGIDRVQDAMRRRDALAAAMLPAARNEEFSRLVAQAG